MQTTFLPEWRLLSFFISHGRADQVVSQCVVIVLLLVSASENSFVNSRKDIRIIVLTSDSVKHNTHKPAFLLLVALFCISLMMVFNLSHSNGCFFLNVSSILVLPKHISSG